MKVIKIGATWCNGCIVMKPRWHELEQENPDLKTEFYDFDESPEIAAEYHVDEDLPVAIFLDDKGQELTRFNGEIDKDVLQRAIDTYRDR